MSELTTLAVDTIVAACQGGAQEMASALGRTLGGSCQLHVEEPANWQAVACDGAGLIVVLQVAKSAALIVVPRGAGFVPGWCANPDATGASKLATLAQELALLALPETILSDEQRTLHVDNLRATLDQLKLPAETCALPWRLESEASGIVTAWMIWPVPQPERLVATPQPPAPSAPVAEPRGTAASSPAVAPASRLEPPVAASPSLAELPPYARSLLKIRVPVTVTLARKKQSIGRILELGVGAIIHFDKSCEEMIDLEVGGEPIAQGEPVKVGDKFGIRLTRVKLPDERFHSVRPG